MDKLLYCLDKQNKDKHSHNWHDKQKYISLFVFSVYGMLGKEALTVLTILSQLMAEKFKEPILHVHGWVNGRIAIAVMRFFYPMFRGSRLPSTLRDREPDWDPGLGLGLAQ